ncbi:MAG: hypothetical protein MUE73_19800 [Planctomycetes bacterium]|jgi:hypothetical protein|nr:hypothetical protein [Planctomycetota bacterium]
MRAIAVLGSLACLSVVVAACGGSEPPPDAWSPPSDVATFELTTEKAEALIRFRCTQCHSDSAVRKARMTADEWRARIDVCKAKPGGAVIGVTERNALADWLARRP